MLPTPSEQACWSAGPCCDCTLQGFVQLPQGVQELHLAALLAACLLRSVGLCAEVWLLF